LEIEEANFRLTDDEARKLIKKVCGVNNISDFQIMDIKKRDTIKNVDLKVSPQGEGFNPK